jgi:F0F1-type ATP synthase epsilon subunit
MKLSVYSLKNILFQGEASLLNCKTVMGEITVLDNHETLITVLSAGVARVVDENKKEHFFEIKSGFLEVKHGNEVRCIVEQ